MARRVVIVGAGITGALTAWRLARAGWSVTVLEARHVGAGSSSRTAAGIRQQFGTPETVMGMRYAVDFYRRFPSEVGGEEVPLVANGYLFLHADEDAWARARARVAVQRRCGLVEVEELVGDALVARFPWVAREAVLGATWCPTDGFLRPELVYNEAIAAAQRLGATLVQNAPVVGVEGRIDVVLTPGGRYPADLVIDATNAWSQRTARLLGGAVLPVAPLKRYLWFAARAGGMSGETLASMPLTIAPSGAYCRPENSERLLIGYAHPAEPEVDFTYEDQDRVDDRFFHRNADSAAFDAWLSLAEAVPALGEFAGLVATTSGYYAATPDHNPYLGFDPVVANLIRLVGFSGHGAMFGPFSSLIGAALAEAGEPLATVEALGHAVPLEAFAPDRAPRHGEDMVI
jgi:glycine/D-amino acid oxidase-like deaminating enzyme